ncbi:UvrD-helicase domain-containing protein [Methylotetracoccus oryzae]|uniref:UvrD-helicase domain-containing protein n=1 Tax=Methylotetracoccus oryzae TaxID=1919059 RepID=UPI0022A6CC29|nr:UvrD-helicase domain-containing protein [Methylotetracoccus oryzae]
MTEQQRAAIEADTPIVKINAVAGSGKTTTLIEYAARRPDQAILYLTYNKSVAEEVRAKVVQRALRHVAVHTIHALAYRHTNASRFELEHELSEWRLLERCIPAADRRTQSGLLLAWLLKDLVNYYLNSAHPGIDDELLERYQLDTAPQARVIALLTRRGGELLGLVRTLLGEMRSGAQPAVHDFYLKLFQFSRQPLPYDVILVDEAQDTSGVMLSVVERQPARKVFVGDTFQQIYGFRHAVNSLERLSAKALPLSQTFRFGDGLAKHIAKQVNEAYAMLGETGTVAIEGTRALTRFGSKAPDDARPLTLIARSNLGLFEACLERLSENDTRFFFQGGYAGYSFLNARVAGAFFLSQGRREKVRDPFLSRFQSFPALKDFAQQTQNQSLQSIIGLVERYGGTLFEFDKQIKARLVERPDADFIFTTTHKAKGQEYDHVEMLRDDFLTRADLLRTLKQKGDDADPLKLREEVNVYYVAATRAKHSIKLAPF